MSEIAKVNASFNEPPSSKLDPSFAKRGEGRFFQNQILLNPPLSKGEIKVTTPQARQNCQVKVRLLCGSEVDILNDGSLDYTDDILKQLDFVIASVHNGFTQSEARNTDRIIKAIENPYVHVIGHPTGRLLNEREPYAVDIDKILKAAKINNKFLELDAFPNRLDLNDVYCKKAKDMGVKICIGSDSHSIDQFVNMGLGISAARRGWLEKEDVVNTLSYEKLIKVLKR
jgi:DNA polymerase (family 10)